MRSSPKHSKSMKSCYLVYTLKKAWLSVDSLIRVSEWVLFLQYMEYIWNCADWDYDILHHHKVTWSHMNVMWLLTCCVKHSPTLSGQSAYFSRALLKSLLHHYDIIVMTSSSLLKPSVWVWLTSRGRSLSREGFQRQSPSFLGVSEECWDSQDPSHRSNSGLGGRWGVFSTYLSSIFIPQSHWSYNLRIYNIFLKKTFLEFTHEVRGANL